MAAEKSEEYFMQHAIAEALLAYHKNEVPIGAIVVHKNKIISRAHNLVETLQDPTAHAEMLALSAAFNFLNCKILTNCTLYTSLEPCIMCIGAIKHSKISTLVYGAPDSKEKSLSSCKEILFKNLIIKNNVLTIQCEDILNKFWEKTRSKKFIY